MDSHQMTGRADIHMHTDASDGLPTARQLLGYVAKNCRLDVIAITDHDTLDASLWAYSRRDLYPFDIIPGVEITSRSAHILGLWVTKPIPKDMSVAETVAAIHEQDGIAILAHPGEVIVSRLNLVRYLRHPEVLLEWKLDAIEIHNAGTMTPGNNRIARHISRHVPLPVVGNSDAHTVTAIGLGVTRFNGHTAAEFRAALATCQTAAEGTTWPLIDYLKLSPGSIHKRLKLSSGPS